MTSLCGGCGPQYKVTDNLLFGQITVQVHKYILYVLLLFHIFSVCRVLAILRISYNYTNDINASSWLVVMKWYYRYYLQLYLHMQLAIRYILYIANHSRWKSFAVAELNFNCNSLEIIRGWTVVLHSQGL